MVSKATISDTVRRIAPSYRIQTATLFGSYARNEADENSNIDVLIATDRGFTLLDASAFQNELEKAFGCKVDVVSCRALRGEFGKQALRDGTLIYERK